MALFGGAVPSFCGCRNLQKQEAPPNGVASLTSEKLQKLILHCKPRSLSGRASPSFCLLASASFLPFVPTAQPLSAGRAQAPRRPPPTESFPRRSSPWPPPPRRHRLELPHGCATPSSLPRRSVPPGAPPMAAPPGAPSLDGRRRPELPPWPHHPEFPPSTVGTAPSSPHGRPAPSSLPRRRWPAPPQAPSIAPAFRSAPHLLSAPVLTAGAAPHRLSASAGAATAIEAERPKARTPNKRWEFF